MHSHLNELRILQFVPRILSKIYEIMLTKRYILCDDNSAPVGKNLDLWCMDALNRPSNHKKPLNVINAAKWSPIYMAEVGASTFHVLMGIFYIIWSYRSRHTESDYAAGRKEDYSFRHLPEWGEAHIMVFQQGLCCHLRAKMLSLHRHSRLVWRCL